jgi:hypothetical protein
VLVKIQAGVNGGFTSPNVTPPINLNLTDKTLANSLVELLHASRVRTLVGYEFWKQRGKGDQGADRDSQPESMREDRVRNGVAGVGSDLDVVCHVSHLVTLQAYNPKGSVSTKCCYHNDIDKSADDCSQQAEL